MGLLNYILAATGIGDAICALTKNHVFGQPETRWPELGEDGTVVQCERCLHIEKAPRRTQPVPIWVSEGLKGFPNCAECQCYPECRADCPDHLACMERLPEYKMKAVPK